MNWGKGLALALASFAALMAWFIVKASQSPEPLVTENYYEQELQYQGRIDETTRANELGAVIFTPNAQGIGIRFPDAVKGKTVTGTLLLQRPNDPKADRTMPVSMLADGSATITADLLQGLYHAQLTWQANGITYFSSDRIVAP